MAEKPTASWKDKEVKILLDIFREETVQLCLEKAKSPKDKNAVYHEVKVKLDLINVHETVVFLLKREHKMPNTPSVTIFPGQSG